VLAIAGMRWPYDKEDHKTVYAPSNAVTEIAIDVDLANLDSSSKQLTLKVGIDLKKNRSIELYQMFKSLDVIGSDGSKSTIAAIWHAGDDYKEFVLGKVPSGSRTSVHLVRSLSASADNDDSSGRIEERLTLSFDLK
jgi:hypothetical protein